MAQTYECRERDASHDASHRSDGLFLVREAAVQDSSTACSTGSTQRKRVHVGEVARVMCCRLKVCETNEFTVLPAPASSFAAGHDASVCTHTRIRPSFSKAVSARGH